MTIPIPHKFWFRRSGGRTVVCISTISSVTLRTRWGQDVQPSLQCLWLYLSSFCCSPGGWPASPPLASPEPSALLLQRRVGLRGRGGWRLRPEEGREEVLWRDWSLSLAAEVLGVGQRGRRGDPEPSASCLPSHLTRTGSLWETELVLICLKKSGWRRWQLTLVSSFCRGEADLSRAGGSGPGLAGW